MLGKITYQKTQKVDANDIANLHKQGIPTGFLSKQSSSFLEALYSYLIKHEIVYVAKDREKVIGFIALSNNTSGLFKRFLKSNFILLTKFVLQNIFSIEFIKKAFETLFAPKKTKIDIANRDLPELLSIVVDEEYRGMNIGENLIISVEQELKQIGFEKYKVLVGASLQANKFYRKNGFQLYNEVELHKGDKSYIYIKDIK